jgi:arsenate reductase
MQTNAREILLYFHSDRLSDRQTVAYAQAIAPYIEAYSFQDANLSTTHWEEILEMLHITDPSELISEDDPFFQEHIKGKDFDRTSWIKILSHNPQIIKAPIAIRGHEAMLCELPKDILRLLPEPIETD